jgi:hypothetical protein
MSSRLGNALVRFWFSDNHLQKFYINRTEDIVLFLVLFHWCGNKGFNFVISNQGKKYIGLIYYISSSRSHICLFHLGWCLYCLTLLQYRTPVSLSYWNTKIEHLNKREKDDPVQLPFSVELRARYPPARDLARTRRFRPWALPVSNKARNEDQEASESGI